MHGKEIWGENSWGAKTFRITAFSYTILKLVHNESEVVSNEGHPLYHVKNSCQSLIPQKDGSLLKYDRFRRESPKTLQQKSVA